MGVDLSGVVVSATRPRGKVAVLLAGMGIVVVPLDQDEGNVDRYVLGKRVAAERRTGSSFLRGIQDKTLFTGAIDLREHFEVPVLIVEGEVDYAYTGFHPQAVRGALSSMIVQYGVSVLASPDVEETAQFLAMIARQEQLGIPDISLIPKRKATDLPDLQRRVVEMLPGCGMVLARELLQHFGSVRRIADAAPEELGRVRGVGARKAAEMHRVLAAEYESVDTERDLEDAIEVEPGLLFRQPVELVGRQLYLYTDAGQRQFVDMAFRCAETDELVLVELKRGRLTHAHADQLSRYLDNAHRAAALKEHIRRGTPLTGLLATVEDCTLAPHDERIRIQVVDRQRAIAVLTQLRRQGDTC